MLMAYAHDLRALLVRVWRASERRLVTVLPTYDLTPKTHGYISIEPLTNQIKDRCHCQDRWLMIQITCVILS